MKELRLQQGFTQERLANTIGMDRGHLIALEKGQKTALLSTLEVFALGLKVSLSDLLSGV